MLQPRIVCINDEPEAWLEAIANRNDTDRTPLKKRLLFVHIDEPVIAPEAVAAHEADLDALVCQGKRRRLELKGDRPSAMDAASPRAYGAAAALLTPTSAGSASLEAMDSGSDVCGEPRA